MQPALRLTFQASSRDKLSVFWDEQISNNSLGAGIGHERTRDRRPQPRLAARAAGEVDIHGHEQPAARGRSRHLPLQLEHTRALRGRPPLPVDGRRPDSGERAVRGHAAP